MLLIIDDLVIDTTKKDQVRVDVDFVGWKVGFEARALAARDDVTLLSDDARIVEFRLVDTEDAETLRAPVSAVTPEKLSSSIADSHAR
jgi:hypothetical protein